MVSDAKKRANAKSDKKNTVGKYLKLIKTTDSDIIEHLEDKAFNTYVKELIRKDMNTS